MYFHPKQILKTILSPPLQLLTIINPPIILLTPQTHKNKNSHLLAKVDIKLPGPQKPQQSKGVQPLSVAVCLESSAQLLNGSIVLLGGVARVARLRIRSGGREIVLVVLGVELHCGIRHGWEGLVVGVFVEEWEKC